MEIDTTEEELRRAMLFCVIMAEVEHQNILAKRKEISRTADGEIMQGNMEAYWLGQADALKKIQEAAIRPKKKNDGAGKSGIKAKISRFFKQLQFFK